MLIRYGRTSPIMGVEGAIADSQFTTDTVFRLHRGACESLTSHIWITRRRGIAPRDKFSEFGDTRYSATALRTTEHCLLRRSQSNWYMCFRAQHDRNIFYWRILLMNGAWIRQTVQRWCRRWRWRGEAHATVRYRTWPSMVNESC